MISTDLSTKKLIKQALSEEYTKENNKTFGLSDNTIQKYKLVHQFLSFIEIKNKEGLLSFLSDDIVFDGKPLEKNLVVDHLISSIPCHFSEIEYTSLHITLAMTIGGNPNFESCIDCPDDAHLFVIPWDYMFCCRVWFKLKESKSYDLNYLIEFDDNNQIIMIDSYKRGN